MPDLPPELEREIFELALKSNHNAASKLALSLVARRVQCWVDLAFYEMVTILHESHAAKFVDLIESNLKPPGFFVAVKILCLPYSVTAEQACAILSVCTEVQLLACWVDYNDALELPPLVGRLPLRRLSVEFRHFLKIPLVPSAWFSDLTHLDLVLWDYADDLPQMDLSALSRLPRVTHVAMQAFRTGPEHAAVVCASCPNLRVLVMITYQDHDDTDPTPDYLFDPRIVVQEGPSLITRDWEAPYFDWPDMWSQAEDVLEERRLGGRQAIAR
ncbi:hypothetical protein B0H15DRAFT_946839 [Mycena belliarum]|uniref:Uncharacterized protein n=1 Tax=Mycena belliarum TaxID=1033014 RepID=A0AAD6XVF7_9AGAR|nr:hypothetical protein B0H15DRAFT_946839 [Mycena belliae]